MPSPCRLVLVVFATLSLVACGTTSTPDASAPGPAGADAGEPGRVGTDAGTTDAGTTDAGTTDAGLSGGDVRLGTPCTTDADCGSLKCRQDPVGNFNHRVCTIPCTWSPTDPDPCEARFGANAACVASEYAAGDLFCAWHCWSAACPAGFECLDSRVCDRADRRKCVGTVAPCAQQTDCYNAPGCARCEGTCEPAKTQAACDRFSSVCQGQGSCLGSNISCFTQRDSASCEAAACTWFVNCIALGAEPFTCPVRSDDECRAIPNCAVAAACTGTPAPCENLHVSRCTSVAGCRVE